MGRERQPSASALRTNISKVGSPRNTVLNGSEAVAGMASINQKHKTVTATWRRMSAIFA
jgi:hypothetical protein